MSIERDREIENRTANLEDDAKCRSDDPHILALAQVSDVRLLYTNDGDLQQDFGNKSLIDNPRGKVYSTRRTRNFTATHKGLLSRTDLCKVDH